MTVTKKGKRNLLRYVQRSGGTPVGGHSRLFEWTKKQLTDCTVLPRFIILAEQLNINKNYFKLYIDIILNIIILYIYTKIPTGTSHWTLDQCLQLLRGWFASNLGLFTLPPTARCLYPPPSSLSCMPSVRISSHSRPSHGPKYTSRENNNIALSQSFPSPVTFGSQKWDEAFEWQVCRLGTRVPVLNGTSLPWLSSSFCPGESLPICESTPERIDNSRSTVCAAWMLPVCPAEIRDAVSGNREKEKRSALERIGLVWLPNPIRPHVGFLAPSVTTSLPRCRTAIQLPEATC